MRGKGWVGEGQIGEGCCIFTRKKYSEILLEGGDAF